MEASKPALAALSSIRYDRASLVDKATEQIIKYIRDNQMQVGDQLPNEKELGGRLNVSRSTIRSAMGALRTRGIVSIQQGSGTYIASTTGVGEDPLGLAFRYDHARTIRDLMELRLMLEPEIAAHSAERASAEDVRAIVELADRVENAIRGGVDHTQWDIEFHTRIAKSTGNELVLVLVPEIARGVRLFTRTTKDRILNETILTHRKVTEAIARHDPQAARKAMIEHLKTNQPVFDSLRDTK